MRFIKGSAYLLKLAVNMTTS